MIRWNRWAAWIALLTAFSLLFGCANAANYVKDTYPLINMTGKGKDAAKVYAAEGKTVPETAKEIAAAEKPKETSKEDSNQMFLIYDNRVINIQKNPDDETSSLVEVNSLEYARQHYDSSFLQGYLTAALLQSLFGGDWWDSSPKRGTTYKGYSTSAPQTNSSASPSSSKGEKSPTTADRTGSFTSKGNVSSGSASDSPGSTSGKSTTGTTGSWSSSSSSTRKNDGSTPSVKPKTSVSSKPSTKVRSGSFKRK